MHRRFVASRLKAKKFFGSAAGGGGGSGGGRGFGGRGGWGGGPGGGGGGGAGRGPADEAREVLASTVLAHVPAEGPGTNFKMKAVFMALMVRRVVEAQCNEKHVDDR